MTVSHPLLFELGCEELPPKSLKKLSQSLQDHMVAGLQEAKLQHGAVRCFATPRRLAVLIDDLVSMQADQTVEKRGPALQAAFAADGTPSKAAIGFASSCGTTVDQLEKLETDKGAWLIYHQAIKGQATSSLIPDIIRKSLAALPIAKRMRWGSVDCEFVRPVHWAVLLYGADIIETALLGVHTGRISRGHRFHAPQPISINAPHDYCDTLLQQGKVIADFEARMTGIRDAANAAAAQVGGSAYIENELLEEVAALNEWPVPVVGNFDPQFLALPMEVLITTMQANQKYFPVKKADGGLLPHFITFANIESRNPTAIQQGNERVVLPRLADAAFFWKQDRKHALADRVERLASMVFQKELGTLADKTERVMALAVVIAQQLQLDTALAERAAHLAKADLLTEMVGEFANLQGIMGRYYALADGEAPEVAIAIEEHYWPKQSGGDTPHSRIGQVVALAEKIDTLCGIFSAGLIPTGDKDPYALRRATLGILRIVIENELALDVYSLFDKALDAFSHAFDKAATRQRLHDFTADRLKGYCLEHGFSADAFEAVLAVNPSQPLDFMQRIRAVQHFRQLPEAESLAAANKRISNLLKKSDQPISDSIGPLVEPAEKNLLAAAEAAQAAIVPLLAEHHYGLALTRLAQLRDSVDAFFDQVMVNTDDADLRNSRLALLGMLSAQFLNIADISKLQS